MNKEELSAAIIAAHQSNRKLYKQTEIIKRGEFITKAIIIETLVNQMLSFYFVQDLQKNKEFHYWLLSSETPTFMSKAKTLQFICETHFKEWVVKHPKTVKKLNDFIETRNKFAHNSAVSISQGGDAKVLKLKTKGKKEDKKKDAKISLFETLVFDSTTEKEYNENFDYIRNALEFLLQEVILHDYKAKIASK